MLHSALQLSRRGYANARRWLEKVFYDRARGIDTADAVTLDSLGLAAEHRQDYHATPWPMLERALSQLEVRDHDVLIDFGCGNGRVVVAAAMRPFRRVIGVELSPELAESARANVESARPNLRCQDVSIVVTDAMRYEIPDDVTIAYFFDPFHAEIFAKVVENLVASLKRRPRRLTIVYGDPEEEKVLLAAGARLVNSFGGMRPTRRWASENSVHVFELGG